MIKEVIGAVGGAIIMTLATYYTMYKLLEEKIIFNKKTFLVIFFHTVIMMSLYTLNEGGLRVLLLYITLVFFGKILFKVSMLEIFFVVFVTYVFIFVSESIYTFIVVFLLKIDISSFKEIFGLTLLSNLFISIIIIFLLRIHRLNSFIHNLIKNINYRYMNKVLIIIFSTLLSLTLLACYIYFEISATYTLLLNLVLIIVYSGLSFMFLKENNEKNKIKNQYDNVVNTSEKYEKAIEQLRMNNHENRNNLIVLKGMMKNENKKVKEYIDDLINNDRKDDNNLLIRTNSIPTGGLQGLIYQKLLDMKEKNIKYHLEVSKDIDKKKIENIDVKANKDLCTIVGVFLDNAIQATENINEKNIGIYLYQENNVFVISISNTYEGKMDLYKMSDRGYTTKSEGHGYGLSLVKEIIEKNHIFQNDMSICGNVFTQKIKLKLDDDNKK